MSTRDPAQLEGVPAGDSRPGAARAKTLFREHLDLVYRRRDRVFIWLMAAQWIFAVGLSLVYSPYAWVGKIHSVHLHVYYSVFLGGALSVPAILLTWRRPGWVVTRHFVAAAQMLWSALFIHLTGGRIETHFHIFGSLAFLAFYRDWKVLLSATVVVAIDHLLRGLFWPESVYGITNPEWWRFLEHAFWVVFEDIVLVMGILENRREMKALAARQTEMEALNASVEQKVIERTRELEASREQYRALVEETRAIPWQMDTVTWRFAYIGPQAGDLLGCSIEEWQVPGFWERRVHPDDRSVALGHYLRTVIDNADRDIEFRMKHDDGRWVWVRSIVSGETGEGSMIRGIMLDITEQQQLEIELQQAQKLESVGRLASGVAHEINTPIQFVSDSVHFLRDAFKDTFRLLDTYGLLHKSAAAGSVSPETLAEVDRVREEADLAYLTENVPKALDRSIDGLGRVASIVRSMKEFAHPDQKERARADLNHALTTTLTIARNEYKYVAEIETDFGDVPQVLCHVGDLNQAFLNILVNGAHAIAEVVKGTEKKGVLRVSTRQEEDAVIVSISDTGGGIPERIRGQVFDPFFTTKAVGKGTGQGLAIARNVVVDKHGGTLTFESEEGRGTTFHIRLPIEGNAQEVATAA